MLGIRDRYVSAVAAAIAITFILMCGSDTAMPQRAHAAPAEQRVGVELVQPTPAVRSGEAVRASVAVSLSAPAEYLEVRLRLRTPQGRLIYQKTEVRSEVGEGRQVITFERPADNPALSQGRYPVEIRVLATGSEPTNASGRVLVLDPETVPQEVALVARVWATPTVTRDGRFLVDPASQPGLQDDLLLVTSLATSRDTPISIIAPPVLLEEIGRIAAGYQTVESSEPVAPESGASIKAAETLSALASAREGGFVTLIDTPYAVPDLAGLASIDASSDLDSHWTRADAVTIATLGSTTAASTAYLGLTPTEEAIPTLSARGTSPLIVPMRSLAIDAEETSPGIRPLGDTGVTIVTPDEDASAAVDLGSADFYDAMFDRLGTGPVTLIMDVGPGATQQVASVQHAIEMIELADWLETTPLGELAAAERAAPVELDSRTRSTASDSHWDTISQARRSLLAYREAVGTKDPDVESSARTLLVTESELWAGSNGTWTRSDSARDMAEEISRFVADEFKKITFVAKDVTLSGSTGEVPFTLVNNTGKHLTLTIVGTFDGSPERQVTRTVEIDPMQNFITVPVDLRNSATSHLRVVAQSGDITMAETTLTVHTSYIDRLATIGIVILVLLVLLVVIRLRMVAPNAATIGDRARDTQGQTPNDEQ